MKEEFVYNCARCGLTVVTADTYDDWEKDDYGRDICPDCVREIKSWGEVERWR